MPKLKNLAALAAAIEAARRYARSNPDKASKYLDQAAAFLDKQTKGKYSSKIDGVTKQVRSAAGLPASSGGGTQSYVANAGYGKHEGYGLSEAVAPDQLATTAPSTTSPSTTSPSPTSPSATSSSATSTSPSSTAPTTITPSTTAVDPLDAGDKHFPGSKDA